jgi:hypothetical protein
MNLGKIVHFKKIYLKHVYNCLLVVFLKMHVKEKTRKPQKVRVQSVIHKLRLQEKVNFCQVETVNEGG